MKRQIVLDTETTGLDVRQGHRVIEIGCIELLGRRTSGDHWHRYLDPERDIDRGAVEVHGLTREFLSGKAKFGDIAAEFVEYLRGAEVLIHNAAFDEGFLDAELARAGFGVLREHVVGIVDTMALARELHPGRRNSLDALCERYDVDRSRRTVHGALLDAGLLAEVYLAMTRGQDSLAMEVGVPRLAGPDGHGIDASALIVIEPDAGELAAHEAMLERMEKEAKIASLWRTS